MQTMHPLTVRLRSGLATETEQREAADELERLCTVLDQIDKIGNGLSADDKGLTAYASLMRCGDLARKGLQYVCPVQPFSGRINTR